MRTTLNLDDDLLKSLVEVTGNKNKTQVINTALSVYLAKLNRESIMGACGKLEFDLDVRRFRNLEILDPGGEVS